MRRVIFLINRHGDELFHTARGKNISQAKALRYCTAAELQSHAPTMCVWVSVQCGGRKYGCCNSVCRRAFREGGIYISLRAVKVIRLVIGAVKNEWAIDALSPRRERRLKCSRRSAAHAHPLIRPILRRAALAKNSIRNFALNDERSPARGDPFCASLSLCFVVFALNWSTLCILSWAEMMRFRFTLSHTERE